jgi:uncharacterized protein (TIGR02145 family)
MKNIKLKGLSINFCLFLLISAISVNAQQVTIGKQIWSAKNLDVSTFRNGDSIAEVKTDEEWRKAGKEKKPVWCYYNNDSVNGKKYGKLYNWYAVNDPRRLSPAGWHAPNDAEWKILIDFLGGDSVAGMKLKSKSGWDDTNVNLKKSGFEGLPAGYRDSGGSFFNLNEKGSWWGYGDDNDDHAWGLSIIINDKSINWFSGISRNDGFSFRCIKD